MKCSVCKRAGGALTITAVCEQFIVAVCDDCLAAREGRAPKRRKTRKKEAKP